MSSVTPAGLPVGNIRAHEWMNRRRSLGRYVAIGDSFTEGVGDELPDGTVRGWADLVAGVLSGGWVQRGPGRGAHRVRQSGDPRKAARSHHRRAARPGARPPSGSGHVRRRRERHAPPEVRCQLPAPALRPDDRTIDRLRCHGGPLHRRRSVRRPAVRAPGPGHRRSPGRRRPRGRQSAAVRCWSTCGRSRSSATRGTGPPIGCTSTRPVTARSPAESSTRSRSTARPTGPPRSAQRSRPPRTARDELDFYWEYVGPWVRRRLTGTSSGDHRPPKRPVLAPLHRPISGATTGGHRRNTALGENHARLRGEPLLALDGCLDAQVLPSAQE